MNASDRQQLESYHLARLRELEKRMNAAQTQEQEASIQTLIDAENRRWARLTDDQ